MVLKRWYRPYQTIINLREAYPPHKFKQPSVFQDPIPGESVYLKYLRWLTDQKTGLVYIDFESGDE